MVDGVHLAPCREARFRSSIVSRVLRAGLYFSMFPIFIVGCAFFYLALRVRSLGLSRGRREEVARFFIHRGAKLLFSLLRVFSLVEVSFDRRGDTLFVPRSAVVVANHPSMLDAMLLLSELPNAVCIMKRSLLRIPILSGFAAMAGYLAQSDTQELLRAGQQVLSRGGSLVIFPEGTRSSATGVGSFHRGAARLAVDAGVPVIAFGLSMKPVVLGRGASWARPPRSVVRYKAVCIEMVKHEMGGDRTPMDDRAREESIRLTKYLEDRIRNSLS